MNICRRLSITVVLCLVACAASAQPVISYILPDIGAPGTATAIEIIGPNQSSANFGLDGFNLNNAGDAVRVVCQRPADAGKVTFGPVSISWSGRMISTMAFVHPDVVPNDHDWTKLRAEFRIPIQVIVNNVVSNIDTFYIVRPWPLGNISALSETILGQGALGRRSRRGAMIVDSLILGPSVYQVSTVDCDPSTPGNQAYLPMVLHSVGSIRGTKVADTIASEISVSAAGIRGGAGGGGGAGSYVNFNFNGQTGTDGGDGFTGGGPGGYNSARTKRKPGVGTGGELPASATNTIGSPSLNGVTGGESTTSFENAGGGTGHPFGTSGTGCVERNGCLPIGGYGGGSGSQEAKRGGAGGYATAGETETPFSNGGQVVGNVNLVPLAGGSGGAGGNPDLSRAIAASGGGGGGALSVHARTVVDVRVTARGGVPTRQDLQGGCGSGGGIIVGGRAVTNVIQNIGANVDGGFDAVGSAATRHLTGGGGRLRVDGPLRGVSQGWTGVSMDPLAVSSGALTLSGTKTNDGAYVWIRTATGPWKEILGPTQVFVPNDRWNATPAWPGSDSVVYVVAAASVPSPSMVALQQQPSIVFSQSAWNVIRRAAATKLAGDTLANLGQPRCPGDVLVDTIVVVNPGPETLTISGAQLAAPPGFVITQEPKYPLTLAPSQRATYVVWYTVQTGQTGTQNGELRINYGTNQVHTVRLQASATPVTVDYFWRGLKRDTLDVGRVCIGRPIVEFLTVRKVGSAQLTIVGFASASPAAMAVTGAVPVILKDEFSFYQLTMTFAAKRAGAQIVPVLVTFKECPIPDTIYIKHTGVESQVTVTGNGQFGDVRVGDRREAIFELRNTGSSELDIRTLPTLPAPFSVVSITPTIPTKVMPGESLILIVAFAPTAVTRSTARFTMVVDSSQLSCADTVEIVLAGNGVLSNVTLSATSLTYPSTAPCDSARQSVTITNNGTTSFTLVSPPVINGVNPTSFRWSGGPLRDTTLRAQESVTYSITFLGSQGPDGVKTAVFSVRTDDPGIGIISVGLNGQRNSAALIGPRIVDLGSVRVGGTINTTINYTNGSTFRLRVINATVTGPNRIGVNPTQFALDPSQVRGLTFTYICRAEENVEDTVRLALDQPCTDTIAIIVRARGGSEQLSASQKINFGVKSECVKGSDSVVYVNSGSLPIELVDVVGITGPDAAAFRVINPAAATGQRLQPGEQRVLRVEFDPAAATDGIKVAYLTVRAKINDTIVPVISELKGERRTSLFITPSSMTFGKVSVTATSTQSLIFTNSGSEPLVISSISLLGGATSGFRVRSNPPVPMTIQPGGVFEITVDFVPTQQKTYIDGVVMKLDAPCSDTRVLTLSGAGVVVVDVVASLPRIVESPSKRDVRLPIRARVTGEATRIDSASFTMRVRYIAALFALREVIGATVLRSEVLGGFTIVELSIPARTIDSAGTVIAELLGDMTIGPLDSTDVLFEQAAVTAPNVTSRLLTQDGSIKITICEAGGDRLVRRSGRLSVQIHPNPVADDGEIVTETYERGLHTLTLITAEGRTISLNSWNHDASSPVVHHRIPVEALPSGLYQVVLETPSRRRILPLSLIR
ncbi:MAG: choice-of-anchor D domain-containing protein [Candidatus Kapabacteria bacterium]|nr:choice-of-anchor D domain-containing protein [Candidatus Kapabacteria bacterium]